MESQEKRVKGKALMFKWQSRKENFMIDIENLWLEVWNGNHQKVVKRKPREERMAKRERSTMSNTPERPRKVRSSFWPWMVWLHWVEHHLIN